MKTCFILLLMIAQSFTSIFSQSKKDTLNTKNETIKNSTLFGFNAGINGYQLLDADLFVGKNFLVSKKHLETNIGYSQRNDFAIYIFSPFMSLKSHTAYFESNYYFSKLFYAGIRFGLNYNILVKESILEMETLTNNTYRTKFWGTVNSLQVGYNQPIGKHFNIRIQGQLGILSYKNNVGWPSKYNDPYVSKKVNVFRENLTLGINYRF